MPAAARPPLRLLVTSPPGTGKTTLCDAVSRALVKASCDVDGFLVHEQRDDRGRRVGFECVTLDGSARAPLALVGGRQTGCTVGKYNVQVQDFEALTLPVLDRVLGARGRSRPHFFIFDEIGKMELFSSEFSRRVRQVLESPDAGLHVLGAVALNGGGFIAQSKQLPGVELVKIDVGDRDAKTEAVAERMLAVASAGEPQPPPASASLGGAGPGRSPPQPGKRRWQPKERPAPAAGGSTDSAGADAQASEAPAASVAADAGGRGMEGKKASLGAGALSFGKGAYGQLGRAAAAGSGDVKRVGGLNGVRSVTTASCGFDHSAVVADGRLFLFGKNHRGQCGQPSSGQRAEKDKPDPCEDVLVPSPAPGLPPTRAVSSVACGSDHVLALLEGGEVWACGDNSKGQCGLGAGSPAFTAAAQRCVRLGSATAVAGGHRHSAALCGGRLYVWGACNQGQLGSGGRKDAAEPRLLDLGTDVRAVALGRWHSLAATAEAVWAFGWGRFGVLGQGDDVDHRTPLRVQGLPGTATGLRLLVSGAVHCGAVVGEERQLLVWGRGQLGRLGLGSEANALLPTPVPGLQGVERLAMGGDFSAVRTAGGAWHIWGKGEEGQLGLGDGDRAKRLRPEEAPALQGVDRLAFGDCHALALP